MGVCVCVRACVRACACVCVGGGVPDAQMPSHTPWCPTHPCTPMYTQYALLCSLVTLIPCQRAPTLSYLYTSTCSSLAFLSAHLLVSLMSCSPPLVRPSSLPYVTAFHCSPSPSGGRAGRATVKCAASARARGPRCHATRATRLLSSMRSPGAVQGPAKVKKPSSMRDAAESTPAPKEAYMHYETILQLLKPGESINKALQRLNAEGRRAMQKAAERSAKAEGKGEGGAASEATGPADGKSLSSSSAAAAAPGLTEDAGSVEFNTLLQVCHATPGPGCWPLVTGAAVPTLPPQGLQQHRPSFLPLPPLYPGGPCSQTTALGQGPSI